jgi:hypothetical protein
VKTNDGFASIIAPDGSVANKPNFNLTSEEAMMLRQYKKFLEAHGLREALYCQDCWDGGLSDGCRAFVTTNQIMIECRCKTRFFHGATY